VLEIVVHPWSTPSVLGESVDASPSRNESTVKEFLGSSSPSKPGLSNKKDDDECDSVGDKRAAHDEMSQTLAEVVTLAETDSGDTSE
jgi:hypothetical protein